MSKNHLGAVYMIVSVLFFSFRQEVFHFLFNLRNIFQFGDLSIKSALSPAFAIQQITEPEEEIRVEPVCNICMQNVFNDM